VFQNIVSLIFQPKEFKFEGDIQQKDTGTLMLPTGGDKSKSAPGGSGAVKSALSGWLLLRNLNILNF
jgi:hypothetical protein